MFSILGAFKGSPESSSSFEMVTEKLIVESKGLDKSSVPSSRPRTTAL